MPRSVKSRTAYARCSGNTASRVSLRLAQSTSRRLVLRGKDPPKQNDSHQQTKGRCDQAGEISAAHCTQYQMGHAVPHTSDKREKKPPFVRTRWPSVQSTAGSKSPRTSKTVKGVWLGQLRPYHALLGQC